MRSIHTLRGVILQGGDIKKIFESPQAGTGWIVKAFFVWPYNMDSNLYSHGKLWKGDPTGASLVNSDAQNSQCFAWSATSGATAESVRYDIIDPDHLITNELHVVNTAAQAISYMVVLEQKSITADEEVLSIIKEKSQDVHN
jgi:hypothetical protein